MDKPQIIGLGLSGLIGTRLTELLSSKYEFISLGRSAGVDITKKETLGIIGNHKNANFVLHLAGKTDVDDCEQDKDLGKKGDAWKINVVGTQNVVDFCRDFGKKIIYISTDFVFDGEKKEEQSYGEEDNPNPINWYGSTKYESEKIVEKSGADYIIARLVYPYRAKFDVRKDFVRALVERLQNGETVAGVTDHIFCPTFIDDIASALDKLIENDAMGIYHVVGADALTPYDATLKIAEMFGLDKSLIDKTTRVEFFANRAPRPYNLNLKNDKITRLGIKMRGFEEGLAEIKKQLENK